MSDLRINGKVIPYPDDGSEPGWGENASTWASEVSTVLDSISGLGTISETQVTLENNLIEANKKSVSGLVFNQNLTTSSTIYYRISRKSDISTEIAETGELVVFYDGSTWKMTREIKSGVVTGIYLDISSTGQVQYYSTNLPTTNPTTYVGFIKFKTDVNIK